MEDRRPTEPSGDTIPEPEPAHTRPSTNEDDSDNEREATELHTVNENAVKQRRQSRILNPSRGLVHWCNPVKRLWRHNIRISVPHVDCRDHLANERTYLAYLRTSLALSMIGVTVAQLYRLQHTEHPNSVFGYFVLSKPVASMFQCAALGTALLGAVRFFRQQSAMAIGRVHAGGWEVFTIGFFVFFLLLGMFAVHVGVDIYKND